MSTNASIYHHVLPEIIAEPWRFVLVCKAHHHFTEIFTSITDEQKWMRFFLLVMCTDGGGGESSPSRPTAICLENEKAIGAYHLNNNSCLKKLLERYCNINSMFGDIRLESK